MAKRAVFLIASVLLMIVLFSFCGKKEEAKKPEYPILTGWLTQETLFEKLPEMKAEMDRYIPDSAAVEYLKAFAKKMNILVMLGTWCSDSRREVPRLLKVMEKIQNNNVHVELYGLDRAKSDSLGLGQANQVEFVPTFILFNESGEFGRIIETPEISMEQDLANLLAESEDQ